MKICRRSLSAFLIATTAMIAPHAFAQEGAAADTSDQPPTESVDSEEGSDIIIVRGAFIPEPLQDTSEVASFLSMEDITRQGDSNAAEALGRVTGLSVSDGRFVYVRGLGERYSSALLNGSPLPSPEPLQRVVPLDLFPSSVLGGVAVQKSYSVDYPGEFGGGVVDLSTIGIPSEAYLELSAGFGVNLETTLATGYTHDGSESDPAGFDDGLRDVPGRIHDAWAAGTRISSANYTPTELQAMGQSLQNAKLRLTQVNDSIPADGSVDISAGNVFDFGDVRFGVFGVLGYSNDWQTRDGVQQSGEVSETAGALILADDYNFTSTDNNVGWDGLLGAGLQFGEHEIKWTNLWIHKTTKETYRRFGRDYLADVDILTERTAWYERELYSSQLSGAFDFGDLDITWRTAFAQTSREVPYEWEVRYVFDDSIDRLLYDGSSRVRNQTNFSDLTDEVGSSGIDVSYAIPNQGVRDTVVSGGINHLDNSRKSDSRTLRFALADALPLAAQQSRVDFLFSDFNINPDRFFLSETTNAFGAYDASLEVFGAYAKVDMEPIPYVRTSFGVRAERAVERLNIRTLFASETEATDPDKLKEAYYLPAATITWNFLDDMQLRLGASQTIGRPQFRELAPQTYLDPDSDRIFFGNPNLRDTRFTNVDARYEFFFGPQQYFTLGAFYKDVKRPVESIVVQQSATVQQSYINAPEATIAGAEAEIKYIFDEVFSEGWLAPYSFLVQASYAYTDSEVKAGEDDFIITPTGSTVRATDFVVVGSRLQGQSEHVASLQLGFEDEMSQGTLLFTYTSERASARGPGGQPDIIQEPGLMLDFVYRRDFATWGRPFTIKFKAGNLLDEDFLESQTFGREILVNQYDLGRSFSVDLSTKF
ncbi:MAG: TonB-dependent receptor [Hyphomonadaceae bacterium]|nr:TonB-dependent receptor [Hyphomonadaceae bacterium]